MDTPGIQRWAIARTVALALIGLTVAGLTFLRLASDDEAVSVREDAEAGDLILVPCDYETESGPSPADCGTLIVAENGSEPQSRLIALPLVV